MLLKGGDNFHTHFSVIDWSSASYSFLRSFAFMSITLNGHLARHGLVNHALLVILQRLDFLLLDGDKGVYLRTFGVEVGGDGVLLIFCREQNLEIAQCCSTKSFSIPSSLKNGDLMLS